MLATALWSDATLRFALLGLATGSLAGLVGLGVVLVYRASGVLNFAAAALGAIGAFVCYSLRDDHGVPSEIALAAGLAVGAVLGAGTFVVMAAIRQSSLLTRLIATLALLSAAQGFMLIVWGTSVKQPDSFLPTSIVEPIGGVRIGQDRLVLIALVVVLAAALRTIYARTSFGLATSAVAENRRIAASAGWSTSSVELANFVLAGVLSALAAILLAPIVTLNATVLSLFILSALAAALVGRFTFFGTTVAAALAIGALQSELALFQPDIASALGVQEQALAGLPSAAPLVVILAYAVVSGRARLGRGESLVRLPLPGTGRVSIVPLAAATILGALLLAYAETWADAIITTLALSILVCSVVVVSGYAGQLSLCQFALGGFGAWVASRLAESNTVPFELALVLGVVATVGVGVVVALPALRTRGINLAIATLALALLMSALVFSNSSATGGLAGVSVPAPSVFGINVDPVEHPQRYGGVVLVALVLVALLVANVRRGRTGRRMLAVRGNERAAAALGVGVAGVKLYAFALAAGVAAVGGVLLAFRHPQIQFREFDVFGSILLVQYAVLGGLGWASGVVAGSLLAPGAVGSHLVSNLWPDIENVGSWLAIVGAFGVVALIRRAPDGVAALFSRSRLGRVLALLSIPRDRPSEPTVAASRSAPPALLEVDEVTVHFGGVTALEAVSFSVRPGEVVGLIGPNGAGKTTLLDVITGFTKPDSGSVRLDRVDISRWSAERRARAGLARSWQAVELFDEMTVRDNLLIACDAQDAARFLTDLVRPGRQPLTQVAQQVIDDFELHAFLDKRPSSLPQGHGRLVGIARAIVAGPSVLLLDEPAAGLGPDETEEVTDVIRGIADRHGIGVLVVEHDVPMLLGVCDRIIALDFGRRIAEGAPSAVASDEHVVRAYLGEPYGDDTRVGVR